MPARRRVARRGRPRRALLAVAIVVVSAACGSAGRRVSDPGRSGAGPAPAAPAIGWRSCPGHGGWQCGTLAVPLDRAHPGPTITLALT
ncbi:MAG TPA: hypothetical protein VN180_04145, partial [Acidimicrobiia bacterium]|nr:hypothetical protein [Acidimicrobiia bacterium]